MITTKKLIAGVYGLNWNGVETCYTIIKKDQWVLTNADDDDVIYTASTKADVLSYARNLIDYND